MNITYLVIGTIGTFALIITSYYTLQFLRLQRNKRHTILRVQKLAGVPITSKQRKFVDGYVPVRTNMRVWTKLKDMWNNPKGYWERVKKWANPLEEHEVRINALKKQIDDLQKAVNRDRWNAMDMLVEQIAKVRKDLGEVEEEVEKEPETEKTPSEKIQDSIIRAYPKEGICSEFV